MSPLRYRRGFTVVELLIVIVVIAILATLTIVSYNGIVARANAASAQSAAQTAYEKVQTYAISNSNQYPPDLATAGISNSNNTSYQYSVNNGVNPATFCVTATTTNVSYYTSNSVGTPTAGGCPGHGVNGVPPITNIATNPSLEIDGSNWAPQWYGAGGGAGNLTLTSAASLYGSQGYRKTWTTAGGGQDIGMSYKQPITAGTTYTFSGYQRASVATSYQAYVYFWDNTNTQVGSTVWSKEVASPANTWLRMSVTATAPANAVNAIFVWGPYPSSGSPGASVGETLDSDGLMITQGSTLYNYADGSTSSSWIWNGTPQASSSTGPAQ